MNINGLNSFFPMQSQSSGLGKASSENESFGDVLQQDTLSVKGRPDGQPMSLGVWPAPAGEKNVTALDAQIDSVDANALPGGLPTAPVLNGPLPDRLIDGPNEAIVIPGTTKTPSLLASQDEGVDSLTRRVVWNDFLRKMKDDLGVTAEDVLGAFAELSDEELSAPPQQTVDKVVMALGLGGQDAAVAKQYFGELIQKTKSKSMGEEIAASERQINLTLMSQREMQRKSMQRSIDQLNQNFMVSNRQRPQEGMVLPALQTPLAQDKILARGALTPGDLAAMQTDPIYAAAKTERTNTVDELVRQFMMPQPKVETLAAGEASIATATPVASAAPLTTAQATTTSAAPALAPVSGLNALLADLTRDSEGEDEADFSSDASYLQSSIPTDSRFAGLAGASASEFQAELASLNQNQEPVAIPELVDRAQLMVHGGGGEMKVTLSPEGLGEVAMRVAVNDGKVSVQMITESDEAKKMIERQLHELKSGLGAQHLNVDSIKIDTATNLGKQLEQQYQDAQRQATQQSMEQFRQETGGWKRSFFEVPSARGYRGQSEAPRDVQAPTSNSRRASSRRLNLVA